MHICVPNVREVMLFVLRMFEEHVLSEMNLKSNLFEKMELYWILYIFYHLLSRTLCFWWFLYEVHILIVVAVHPCLARLWSDAWICLKSIVILVLLGVEKNFLVENSGLSFQGNDK